MKEVKNKIIYVEKKSRVYLNKTFRTDSPKRLYRHFDDLYRAELEFHKILRGRLE